MKAMTSAAPVVLRRLSIAFGVFTATLDMILAASMIHLLYRSRTGFQRTNAFLSRLIVVMMSTGLLSAMMSTAQIVLVSCALCFSRHVMLNQTIRSVSQGLINSHISVFMSSEPNVGFSHCLFKFFSKVLSISYN